MPQITLLFALSSLLIASLGACTAAESPTEAREQAVGAPSAPSPAAPVAPPEIDPNLLPSPPESPAAQGPISNPDELRLREMLAALSEAAEAAAETDPNGSHCERAYESSRRLAIALSESQGGSPVQEETPANKARFVAGCERLPAETQRCMVVGYSVAHRDECAELRRNATPEIRAAVREVMTGLGILANTALPVEE